jgi:hypothetical protein
LKAGTWRATLACGPCIVRMHARRFLPRRDAGYRRKPWLLLAARVLTSGRRFRRDRARWTRKRKFFRAVVLAAKTEMASAAVDGDADVGDGDGELT